LDGENTQLEFHLQEAQAEKIKLSEEIAAYREKIVQRPELPWNYCHLGNILADLGEDAEPIALQQQASVLRGWHEAGETRNYRFHYDWFTHNISIWQKYLEGFIDLPNLKILEIGSFEGMATCWFLDRILTHPSAKITCIDIYFQRDFDYNIAQTQSSEKVTKLIGSSHEILQTLDRQSYDAIYIDGNHAASHVRQDALLCWDLLKYEGLAIFDDYELTYRNHPEDNPQVGIDAFLESVKDEIEVIYKGYQLIVRKKLAT
jgi:predicted O-methyltransferase YrrM